MGRRTVSTKKNQENQMIDLSMNDQLECENTSSKRNNVSTEEETAELANGASCQKETLESTISPRRSQRLHHNAASSSQVLQDYIQLVVEKVEPVIKNMGSESREEDPQGCGEKNNPRKSTEEKIDHLFQLIEEQRKTIKSLISKEADKICPSQNRSLAEIRLEMKINKYKNMYVDSHKKIINLEEENYELTKKLECARAKLEGYENGQHVFSGALERLKDVLFLSRLSKTTETTAGHASPNLCLEAKTQAAKRKKTVEGEASLQAGERRMD